MTRKNHVTIRIAEKNDVRALAELRWQLCADYANEIFSSEKRLFIETFSSQLEARSHRDIIHFLAEAEGTIVAVMSVVKVQGLPHPDKLQSNGVWGYLTNVYTSPTFRNKGIGSHLLVEVRHWAQKQNLELLVVWPSEKSDSFYKRAGFARERDPLVLKITPDSY